ncbi:YqiA/YcfP family alpha/beta fold hydrolase [Hydrogenophaga sp. T2]|uniref:YqiA/YcfP family alpha/beta fold hydrolase n=1 Tax=Hydrogenophaga sp. T2 TaxID=3132823 RepID=UPI003CE7ED06
MDTPVFEPLTEPVTHLLYLHGFRSSPLSQKAQLVAERVAREHPGVTWWCPPLPPSPREAMGLVSAGVAGWPRARMAVVGSSLGGFYARWLALHTGCRAALLNPAPRPADSLAAHIGEHSTWQKPDEHFFFEARFVEELRAQEADIARLAPQHPATPERLFALIAKGDELLDWREMQAFAAGGQIRLLEHSDHAISDFDRHIGVLFGFLRLA